MFFKVLTDPKISFNAGKRELSIFITLSHILDKLEDIFGRIVVIKSL